MRRPALLIAGMLLATSASFAVATPASAAGGSSGGDSHRWHCQRHHDHDRYRDWNRDWWDNGNRWSAEQATGDNHRRRDCRHRHRHGGWSVANVSGGVVIVS